MASKEELERLKQQLKEEEEKLRLEEEIAVIQQRLETTKKHVNPVKAWLKQSGYWNSFILMIIGIVLAEIGYLTLPFPIAGVGVLMILGGAMLTPFLRPFWDNGYTPPRKGA